MRAVRVRGSVEEDEDVLTRAGARDLVVVWVRPCCWISTGWELCRTMAPYPRGCFMPSSAVNFQGAPEYELRYDTAAGVMLKTKGMLETENAPLLKRALHRHWTPHSPPSFATSAAKALTVPRKKNRCLGGWTSSATGRSDW